MTTKYKTPAFIFKKTDRNESDKLFSVFTKDFGRLDVSAKALRKHTSKLRSGIDIFFLSEIEFIQGKNKKTLTDAVAIERFNNISKNLVKFKIAHRIGEVLDNFIKGQEEDIKVFNLLKEVFCKLNNQELTDKKCIMVYHYFLWNVLSLLGYRPEVADCGGCKSKLNQNEVYFSNKIGGAVCHKCSIDENMARKINADVVKILRLIFVKDWDVLSKIKMENFSHKLLGEISNNYYSYILSSHSFKNSCDLISYN